MGLIDAYPEKFFILKPIKMSVSNDVSREILQLLGYEEMVKIGYTGDIFKRQFKLDEIH